MTDKSNAQTNNESQYVTSERVKHDASEHLLNILQKKTRRRQTRKTTIIA